MILQNLLSVLPWILPPILGAIIGYVTNAVAITMLFRPYREKKLFGVHVPFTPGIIPRQRKGLAESVGNMVAKSLLTEDALRKQINTDSFKNGINKSIASLTDSFCNSSISNIQSVISKGGKSPFFEEGSRIISDILKNFLNSEGFAVLIKEITKRGINHLSLISLDSLFTNSHKKDAILNKIIRLFFGENGRENIFSLITNWLEQNIESNRSISDFLSEKTVEKICLFLDSLYPLILKELISLLNEKDVKSELEIRGLYLLEEILERLNTFQKFIVSAAQYDKALKDNMDKIVSDVIDNFEDAGVKEKNRKRLILFIKTELQNLSKKGFADLNTEMDNKLSENICALAGTLLDFISKGLKNKELISKLKVSLDDHLDKTLGEIAEQLFGIESGNAANFLSDRIITGAGKSAEGERNPLSAFASKIIPFLSTILSGKGSLTVKEILSLEPEIKGRIDSFLSSGLIGIVDSKVPDILANIDINALVVDKINSFNVEEVERLVRSVVQKQLRWINIFGAFLGAVIGTVQLISRFFTF